MAEVDASGPEQSLSPDDPGDETGERYRYQWAWAAVKSCAILDPTTDVLEVFCEHHEDVLSKHDDGSFTGDQVKTRDDDQPLWKANDPQVINACSRFARLNKDYPNKFRRFNFLTNHPLHSAGNGQDLAFLLDTIRKSNSIDDLKKIASRWLEKIAKTDSSLCPESVYDAMRKTYASSKLPKLRDIMVRVVASLTDCCEQTSNYSYPEVMKAAEDLVDECMRASTLAHKLACPSYLEGLDSESELKKIIEGKRVTLARINRVVEDATSGDALLAGDPAHQVEPSTGSAELMKAKLTAGGFSFTSIRSAEDLRDKSDYEGLRLINKDGVRGRTKYDHLRSIALREAGGAFEDVTQPERRFGPAMREALRDRLRARVDNGESFFGWTVDHMEGLAFSLTSQCEVQWSNERPWEEE